ncbi:cytochrome P450 6j1-like [Hetaerina americana]|uniref:cytochrome P450 6j1-like n=1 Tax=Hetaerina americana TaxID=62018 RepID=UPI003A7F325B
MTDSLSWLPWGQWSLVEVIAIFAISIGLTMYRFSFASLVHWKRNGIPHVPAWPFFGSISDAALVRKPIGEVYADIYNREKGKRYVGFYKFTQPAILLRDPKLVKKVIVTDFDYFPSNEVQGDEHLDPMFGRHLFALSGVRWSRLRDCLVHGFTDEKLREIFALLPEVCDILRDHVDQKTRERDGTWEVELRELCTNFTTSTLSTCALGIPCDAINHPETELRSMVRLLLEPTPKKVLSQLIFLQIPWLAKLLRIPFVPREVTEYFRETVCEEVKRREQENVKRNDYMQMLIRLWNEGRLRLDQTEDQQGNQNMDKGKRSEVDGKRQALDLKNNQHELDDITAVALAFVSDGTVTTASLLSFAFFELAHYPDVQSTLRKEVIEVLEHHEGIVTFAALQKMTYLDMVLLEVLRLYPPAPFMTRSCAKSYQLPNPIDENSEDGGLMLDKGIPVVVPVYGIQRDNDYFPDAEEFNPNRFSKEAIKERRHFTYYPYGEGPRICIGVRFGLLQAKAAIARLLPLIKLIPHKNTPRPITLDPHYFITMSKGGLWIQMQKIH